MDISVITATRDRPKHLARTLEMFRVQDCHATLRCEHIVVSDEPDPRNRFLASRYGARYAEHAAPMGLWGAGCKDTGIGMATGRYVVFWDDDNIYHRDCLANLYRATARAGHAGHYDIGICQCEWLGLVRLTSWCGPAIPVPGENPWPAYGDVDTMCLCVRTSLAREVAWHDGREEAGTDYRWLSRLLNRGAVFNFRPVVIGKHL
jgi:GT2 family glycosyltransferase